MKVIKFLALTILTCGLYLVWLLLRKIFGRGGGKRQPGWGKILIKTLPFASEKEVHKELKTLLPFITKEEFEHLVSFLKEQGDQRIAVLVDKKTYLSIPGQSFETINVYQAEGGECCGGDFFQAQCGCGIRGQEGEVYDYLILPGNERGWRRRYNQL